MVKPIFRDHRTFSHVETMGFLGWGSLAHLAENEFAKALKRAKIMILPAIYALKYLTTLGTVL